MRLGCGHVLGAAAEVPGLVSVKPQLLFRPCPPVASFLQMKEMVDSQIKCESLVCHRQTHCLREVSRPRLPGSGTSRGSQCFGCNSMPSPHTSSSYLPVLSRQYRKLLPFPCLGLGNQIQPHHVKHPLSSENHKMGTSALPHGLELSRFLTVRASACLPMVSITLLVNLHLRGQPASVSPLSLKPL